ncbi:class I SAM-dependent methyltransferase [Frisingicoccus sp.]|uniref:class I SAM-dependent methyltransferase n=1 Tax=Frisingicoccus sp. TaxID=1918627 RepID=UPI003AB2C939
MEKVYIEKNTVQETLVIPLYARKLCSERFPELFRDEKAMELMERLDYDFSRIEKDSQSLMQRFGALEVAMRQNDLAIEVRDYLKAHPKAAVVNLGCGLDQTGENCDNGQCQIYNVDLADVITLRGQLLPEKPRVHNIAGNLKNTAWFSEIDGSQGAVFFAAGVFYYFRKHEVKALVHKMSRHFPGSRLVFDIAGKRAVAMMIKTWVKQAGIEDVGAFFHVNSVEKDVIPWMKGAKMTSRGYMLGYNDLKDPSVSRFFRLLARLGDRVMRMQIVRIDF